MLYFEPYTIPIQYIQYLQVLQIKRVYSYHEVLAQTCVCVGSSHWGLQLNFSPSAVGEDACFSLPAGQTSPPHHQRSSTWMPQPCLNTWWRPESLWRSKTHLKGGGGVSWYVWKRWRIFEKDVFIIKFCRLLEIITYLTEDGVLRFKDLIWSLYWLNLQAQMKVTPLSPWIHTFPKD